MRWHLSHRADPRALPLANRHYNRQTPESPQFVPPGRCLVLLTEDASALWVTSWPQFVKHAWPGSWVNTLFRNEQRERDLSSELITEAVAATLAWFGTPPPVGVRHLRRQQEDPAEARPRALLPQGGVVRRG